MCVCFVGQGQRALMCILNLCATLYQSRSQRGDVALYKDDARWVSLHSLLKTSFLKTPQERKKKKEEKFERCRLESYGWFCWWSVWWPSVWRKLTQVHRRLFYSFVFLLYFALLSTTTPFKIKAILPNSRRALNAVVAASLFTANKSNWLRYRFKLITGIKSTALRLSCVDFTDN